VSEAAIAAALGVGVGIGLLGHVFALRGCVPPWVPVAVGVLAALSGTVAVQHTRPATAGLRAGDLLMQVLLAALAVAAVVGVERAGRSAKRNRPDVRRLRRRSPDRRCH
jgi:hypothetical protein